MIPLLNVPDWRRREATPHRARCRRSSLVEDVAVVSVVGDGLAATTEPLARFLSTLRAAQASPAAITRDAAAPRRAHPAQARSAEAQRALHRAFVEA